MPKRRVVARLEIADEAIVDVAPVIRTDVLRRDLFGLDLVDCDQHRLDLGPAGQPQQRHPAGRHKLHRRKALAGADGLQDVDPALDRAIVVRGPADEGEYAAGIDADDANRTASNRLLNDPAEAQPAFDASFDPCEFDGRALAHERFSPL